MHSQRFHVLFEDPVYFTGGVLGTGVEVHEMDEGLILDAIGWLRQRGAG